MLNDNPPPASDGWKIGRNETVAVYFEDVWYRAMAVKKNGPKYLCYLIDFGNLTTISQDLIRPLPEEYFTVVRFSSCENTDKEGSQSVNLCNENVIVIATYKIIIMWTAIKVYH